MTYRLPDTNHDPAPGYWTGNANGELTERFSSLRHARAFAAVGESVILIHEDGRQEEIL